MALTERPCRSVALGNNVLDLRLGRGVAGRGLVMGGHKVVVNVGHGLHGVKSPIGYGVQAFVGSWVQRALALAFAFTGFATGVFGKLLQPTNAKQTSFSSVQPCFRMSQSMNCPV